MACAGHAGPIRYPGRVCASGTLASPCRCCAGPGGAPLCHAPACRAPLPAATPFNSGRTTVAFVLGITGGRSLTPFTLQSIERGRFGVLAVLAPVVGAPACQQQPAECHRTDV